MTDKTRSGTYACSGNSNLNLSLVCTHQLSELVADTLQYTQSVVLGESVQKVLNSAGLVGTSHVLLEFLDNAGLVLGREGWCAEDLRKFGIFLHNTEEVREGGSGRIEGRRLSSGSVLWEDHMLAIGHVCHVDGLQLIVEISAIGCPELLKRSPTVSFSCPTHSVREEKSENIPKHLHMCHRYRKEQLVVELRLWLMRTS